MLIIVYYSFITNNSWRQDEDQRTVRGAVLDHLLHVEHRRFNEL